MTCANCGQLGHVYKKCSQPITSYGIICVHVGDDGIKYLMVQRKDSLSYVEFLRGKYSICNSEYIYKLVSHMTFEEQSRLLTYDFSTLWKYLWQVNDCMSFRREYDSAKMKFEQLFVRMPGVMTISDIVRKAKEQSVGYAETEWGFAKGRRNIGESDDECAKREFYEESGMPRSTPLILSNDTLEEVFVGSNGMKYRHVYFIATHRLNQIPKLSQMNNREVGAVGWFKYEDAQSRIREYNPERKDILAHLHRSVILE